MEPVTPSTMFRVVLMEISAINQQGLCYAENKGSCKVGCGDKTLSNQSLTCSVETRPNRQALDVTVTLPSGERRKAWRRWPSASRYWTVTCCGVTWRWVKPKISSAKLRCTDW